MDFRITNTDIQGFLDTMLVDSKTEILDASTIGDDLREVAKNVGISIDDNPDIAFFKNIYAITDKANKNRCRLPKEIIENALHTIRSKPVDIDHIRKYVIGHYL